MHTWRSLNAVLSKLSEDELLDLLEAEIVGRKRVRMLSRLHQRYCIVRSARERINIMRKATGQ